MQSKLNRMILKWGDGGEEGGQISKEEPSVHC